MTTRDGLIRELTHEARTTRRHLERLPEGRLGWRPHDKSFTAGALACHIVDCLDWTAPIFTKEEHDMDPASYRPYRAVSLGELLAAFDERVTRGTQAMAGTAEDGLQQPWRLKIRGRLRFERPRADVFRDMTLSHLIHHRGQLSVYLRLLDVAVPGSYGPSAD